MVLSPLRCGVDVVEHATERRNARDASEVGPAMMAAPLECPAVFVGPCLTGITAVGLKARDGNPWGAVVNASLYNPGAVEAPLWVGARRRHHAVGLPVGH